MEFVHKPKNHSNLKNLDVVLWFIVETWCNCKSMKMFIKKKVSFFYFIFRGDISTPWLKHEPLEVGCCVVYYKSCRICVETMLEWEKEEGYDWSGNPIFFLFFHLMYVLYPFILLSPHSPTASLQYDQISVGYQHRMLLGYYLWVFGVVWSESFVCFLFLFLVCLVCGCKVKFYDGTCLVSVSGTNWKSAIHVMFVRTRERIFRSWSLCNNERGKILCDKEFYFVCLGFG